MTLWRISDYRTLNGHGGLLASGRWHTAGRPIVYLAEHPAGAMLEALVHLEMDVSGLPPEYTLLRIEAPHDLLVQELATADADPWARGVYDSRQIGDFWLEQRTSALARVPSSIVPMTWNILLNPAHVRAAEVQIVEASLNRFDPRLVTRSPF